MFRKHKKETPLIEILDHHTRHDQYQNSISISISIVSEGLLSIPISISIVQGAPYQYQYQYQQFENRLININTNTNSIEKVNINSLINTNSTQLWSEKNHTKACSVMKRLYVLKHLSHCLQRTSNGFLMNRTPPDVHRRQHRQVYSYHPLPQEAPKQI